MLQRRRHVRDPRAVRGAQGQAGAVGQGRRRRTCASSSRRSRRRWSWPSAPRRSTAWAPPAASSCRCRTAASAGLGAAAEAVGRRRGRGQRRARAGRAVQQLPRQPAAALRRPRPRRRRRSQGVSLSDVFQTLQAYLGSAYVNDFTFRDRNWQVNVQADAEFRLQPEDIGKLKVRNARRRDGAAGDPGERPRLPPGRPSSTATTCIPSAEINGNTAPGVSSGQAIAIMETSPGSELPPSMGFEWTELTLQQILAGNTADQFVFSWARCSCSWCWRRSTRAGRCRWRSS